MIEDPVDLTYHETNNRTLSIYSSKDIEVDSRTCAHRFVKAFSHFYIKINLNDLFLNGNLVT